MTTLIDDELALVSPRRLGAILRAQRESDSRTLEEMARSGGGAFLASDLEAFERGRKKLDDATATALAEVYGLSQGPLLPFRSKLVIDLDAGTVEAGDQTATLAKAASPDQILARYLAMVQVLRAWSPGQPFPLRADDLDVLGTSLDLAPATVEQRLRELLVLPEISVTARRLRRALIFPAAGLLVGTTAVGALILVVQQSDTAGQLAAPQAQPVQVAVSALASSPLLAPITQAVPAAVAQPAPETSITEPELLSEAVLEPAEVLVAPPTATDAELAPAPAEVVNPVVVDPPVQIEVAPEVDLALGIVVELGEPVVVEAPDEGLAQRGAAAENLIAYPWQTLLSDWTVEYLPSAPGLAGNTNVPSKTISIYLSDGQAAEQIAGILAHEVGHALDITYLDDAARQQWLDARGASDVSWWPTDGLNDFSVGSGDFAEAVAATFANSPSTSFLSGPLTAAHFDLVRQLLP